MMAKTPTSFSTLMSLTEQWLLMCSALGGLNGLLLAGFFALQRKAQLSHRLLALLMLMLSVRVLKSVLFYFNPDIGKQILQLGLSACALIGPLLYCYSQSSCNSHFKARHCYWQLGSAFFIIALLGWLWPYNEVPTLWQGPLYQLINYSWLGYILLSAYLWFKTQPQLRWRTFPMALTHPLLLVLIISNLLLWLAYHFASYTSYISGALTFSVLLCLSAVTAMLYRTQVTKTATTAAPYANKKLAPHDADRLCAQLQQWMTERQPYLDPSLTMPKLARQLSWPSTRLSQLLNDNLAQSFSDYINSWRIAYAQQLLRDQTPTKMQALAEQAGFNSLSTFYAAFKKFSGLTPALYKQKLTATASETINS